MQIIRFDIGGMGEPESHGEFAHVVAKIILEKASREFVMCMVAGIKMEYTYDAPSGTLTMKTKHPVSFYRNTVLELRGIDI